MDVVALVVLRSASGRPLPGDASITTETLAQFAPDPSNVTLVATELSRLGFRVGPPVGVSMSIEADRSEVERVFGVQLDRQPDGSWIVHGATPAAIRELPVGALSDAVASRISAVVLEEPVELHGDGPANAGGDEWLGS